MELQGKAKSAIQQYLKNTAQDTIPTGEELASALTKDETMTTSEWLEYNVAPDIILEKEMVWPVDPDLVY